MPKIFKADWNRVCSSCGADVPKGTSIYLTKDAAGKWQVKACPACDRTLAAQALEPPRPPVEARVRVLYVKASRDDWSAARVRLEGCSDLEGPVQVGQECEVTGKLGRIRPGDTLDVKGTFEQNPPYGWQLVTKVAVPVVAATDEALCRFLARFPQVGSRRAEQIFQTLGGREAVLHALEHDPAALTQVAGITQARAEEIAKAYQEGSTLKDALLFLAELNLGEALNAKLLSLYGENTRMVLTSNPYDLLDVEDLDISFSRVDEIARNVGIGRDDPRYIAAATRELVKAAEREGHTWHTKRDLLHVSVYGD